MPGKIRMRLRSNLSVTKLEKSMLDTLAKQLNERLKRAKTKFRKEVRKLIKRIILNTPEAESLYDGRLAHEFGFYPGDGVTAVIAITNKIAQNSRISFTKIRRSGKQLVGRIKIGAVISDFSDVLSLGEGISFYHTEEHNDKIDWLRWLLLEGDKVINAEYGIVFGKSKTSRSGNALMIRLGKLRRTFRVSPVFSGTKEDNWLTRAFVESRQIFITEVLKILKGLIL